MKKKRMGERVEVHSTRSGDNTFTGPDRICRT